MAQTKLNRCECGSLPRYRCERVAEDAEECWVECKCGRRTEEREGAYCDFASAAWDWNAGDIVRQPTT